MAQWRVWLSNLTDLRKSMIDRCLQPVDMGNVTTIELHHFADASQKGYGAVSYLRLVNEAGDIHCALLMSKSKLTPIKYQTIPRLELSAAAMSVKLDQQLRRELDFDITRTVYWTDSMLVLHYL